VLRESIARVTPAMHEGLGEFRVFSRLAREYQTAKLVPAVSKKRDRRRLVQFSLSKNS
jgi:hypothetical protein